MVAAASAAVSDGDTLEVSLPPAAVEELLARVQPRPGVYRLPAVPQLEFEVIGRA